VKYYLTIFSLFILKYPTFSQNIFYEDNQSGFGFFGTYSGDIYANTFGIGGSYTYESKLDFAYSYGYTIPKPNSEALYARGNRFSLSYLFRKEGNLGNYALEPAVGFSFGKDQETRYQVISGGLAVYKPIPLSEISGIIPEFSVGGRLVTDTQYRFVMVFVGGIIFHIRASKINRNSTYIKGGLILTTYGNFYYIKIGIALHTKK